jgi:hypothetical protein
MTVTHLASVVHFEIAMEEGGTHSFEITADEMPELNALSGLDKGVEVPYTHLSHRSVWESVRKRLANRGVRCVYKRKAPGIYVVTCTIPSPEDAVSPLTEDSHPRVSSDQGSNSAQLQRRSSVQR